MRHKITLDSNDIELAIMQWFKEKNKNKIVYNGQWEFDVFYHCELKEIEWAKEPGEQVKY